MTTVIPVPEIVYFTVPESYHSEPGNSLKDVQGSLIKNKDGFQSSYSGIQVEDSKTGIVVNVWGDANDGDEHVTKTDKFPDLTAWHIKVTADPIKPLSAPVTELAKLTLKSGASITDLATVINELEARVNTEKGIQGFASGPSVEDSSVYFGIIGWDTVDAHWEAVAEGTVCHGIIGRLASIVDISIKHVKFSGA